MSPLPPFLAPEKARFLAIPPELQFAFFPAKLALAGEPAAFDCAVSLKIASRFRGARGALDEALRAFLAWSEARHLEQSAGAAKRLAAQLERDGFLP